MNPPLFDLDYCPILPALEVIGGKWKPLVVYHIYLGAQRFGELQRRIPAISKTMLTQQLRELERDGLLHRQVFAEVPSRVEYTLTETGLTLLPVLKAIGAWGRQLKEQQFAPSGGKLLL
ncbi:winged helix-turn-helix transcriptional regulator [Hymenobacter daeguensis]